MPLTPLGSLIGAPRFGSKPRSPFASLYEEEEDSPLSSSLSSPFPVETPLYTPPPSLMQAPPAPPPQRDWLEEMYADWHQAVDEPTPSETPAAAPKVATAKAKTTTEKPKTEKKTALESLREDYGLGDSPNDLALAKRLQRILEPTMPEAAPYRAAAPAKPPAPPLEGTPKYTDPFAVGIAPASRPAKPLALQMPPPPGAPSSILPPKAMPAGLPPEMRPEEQAFRDWATQHKVRNPDDPKQFYDYRAAYAAGAEPDATGHWPSDFKLEGHPDLIKGGFNTKTLARVPGTKQASEKELIRLGYSPDTAKALTEREAVAPDLLTRAGPTIAKAARADATGAQPDPFGGPEATLKKLGYRPSATGAEPTPQPRAPFEDIKNLPDAVGTYIGTQIKDAYHRFMGVDDKLGAVLSVLAGSQEEEPTRNAPVIPQPTTPLTTGRGTGYTPGLPNWMKPSTWMGGAETEAPVAGAGAFLDVVTRLAHPTPKKEFVAPKYTDPFAVGVSPESRQRATTPRTPESEPIVSPGALYRLATGTFFRDAVVSGVQAAQSAADTAQGLVRTDEQNTIIRNAVEAALPPERAQGVRDETVNAAIVAVNAAMTLPEAAVGLASATTGGEAGKFAHDVLKFQPDEARKILYEYYSPAQKAAFDEVAKAHGFIDKTIAALANPSTIVINVAESIPLMLAGAATAEVLAAGGMEAGWAAGVGEGLGTFGSGTEQTRAASPTGLLTPEQVQLNLIAGMSTTAIGRLGNAMSEAMGVHDVDALLIAAAGNQAAKHGLVTRLIYAAGPEALEEFAQGIPEQVLQNKAQGRPWNEGVDDNAVMGALAGAVMGAGGNIRGPIRGQTAAPAAVEPQRVFPRAEETFTEPPAAVPPPPLGAPSAGREQLGSRPRPFVPPDVPPPSVPPGAPPSAPPGANVIVDENGQPVPLDESGQPIIPTAAVAPPEAAPPELPPNVPPVAEPGVPPETPPVAPSGALVPAEAPPAAAPELALPSGVPDPADLTPRQQEALGTVRQYLVDMQQGNETVRDQTDLALSHLRDALHTVAPALTGDAQQLALGAISGIEEEFNRRIRSEHPDIDQVMSRYESGEVSPQELRTILGDAGVADPESAAADVELSPVVLAPILERAKKQRAATPPVATPVATTPEKPALPGWLGEAASTPKRREAVFQAMRQIDDRAEAHLETSRQLTPPQGTIGVGMADQHEFQQGETRREFLRVLNRGGTPEEAAEAAKKHARYIAKKANARRPGDIHSHLPGGSVDAAIEDAVRAIHRAAETKPIPAAPPPSRPAVSQPTPTVAAPTAAAPPPAAPVEEPRGDVSDEEFTKALGELLQEGETPETEAVTPTEREEPHATETREQPEGDQREHPEGGRGGETAEAGGGHRAVERETPSEEAVTRPTREDGRLIPQAGDKVYQTVRGFGGTPAYIHGEVYARGSDLRVRVTGAAALIGSGPAKGKTYQLSEHWTVQGDPEVARRKAARETAETERKAQDEREERESQAERRQKAQEAIRTQGHEPLTRDTPVGSTVLNHFTGETGTVDEQHPDYGPLIDGRTLGNPDEDGTWGGYSVEPTAAEARAPVSQPAESRPTKAATDLIARDEKIPVKELPRGQDPDWTEIGKNAIGQTLYQDRRGVRSYIENGVRQHESVQLTPKRGGMEYSVDRSTEPRSRQWNTAEAHAFRYGEKPTTPAVSQPAESRPTTPVAGTPAEQQLAEEKAKIEAQIAERVKRIKARLHTISANAPFDTELLGEVAFLARDYVRLGIVNFRAAALRFRQDFGEMAEGERYFETAWLLAQEVAKGKSMADAKAAVRAITNKPTVAAEVEAYNKEVTDGDTRDRPGPAAESGGTPADTVRDGGEGVLGAVPAETGAATGPTGAERPGRGDQEGHPPGGVPDQPDTGAEPEPPPRAGGGIVPSGSVPISGETGATAGPVGITGVQPPDYTLTPERIAGIINRGTVERARDNIAAIRLVQTLTADHRYPTVAEQEVLAKYVGWGASDIQQYLEDSPRAGWSDNVKALWADLRELTTKEQRKALIASAPNAHFTFDLYQPIWAALEWMGFGGGRVLEPSVGVGHALGLMPPAIRAGSTINASELEPLTAAMAGFLYPSARVQPVGFEKIRLPRNTQDLVISNVPFGRFGTTDRMFTGPRKFITEKIHSYFFAKGLELTRPGGYVVFVTSRYTMDGPEHQNIRNYLMTQGHFVGAVRLPGGDKGAFVKSAKTEVVTDLIVLQKFTEGEQTARNADLFKQSPLQEQFSTAEGKDWRGRKVPARNVYRSAWYDQHPQFILGNETMAGSQYSANEYTVEARPGEDVQEALETALKVILPKNSYQPATTTSTAPDATVLEEHTYKPGELRVGETKGTIQRALLDGTLVDATPRKKDGTIEAKAVLRLTGMIGIRDARRVVVDAMRSATATDAAIKKAQGALRRAYDKFQKEYGDLNKQVNKALFKSDPDMAAVLALENLKTTAKITTDKNGKQTLRVKHEVLPGDAGKADIFTKRTINAPPKIEHVETPKDALFASLGTQAAINWPFMARVTGDGTVTPERIMELQQSLKADGHIFEQPDGTWVVRDEYLSGDVVSKLADADAAADAEPDRYTANVEALTKVQPTPKTAAEVKIGLGVHWVDPGDLSRFVQEAVGSQDTVTMRLDGAEQYVRWTGEYGDRVLVAGMRHALAVRFGRTNEKVYGFTDLLDDALNLKMPDLGYWETDAQGTRRFIKQESQTQAARANIEELRDLWAQWVYNTPDVLNRTVDFYNTRYNRTVERTFDGSHLANYIDEKTGAPLGPEDGGVRSAALPGLTLPFGLFAHQLRAVWRILTSGNTLLAHEVGAGKTFEMIVAAMEMKRTGRARKPMITVPTHLLAQWRKDIMKAYPTAKLLAFEEKDLSSKKRQEAMARIAHGDWDIVLVPHSSFELLKVSKERMATTLQEWVDEITAAESAARAEHGKDDQSVKKLEEARRRIEDKVRALLEKADKGADNALTWEQLGVDALMVDEAHAFKNLYFFSKIDTIRGLSRSNADKSLDMFIKVKDINEASNYRNLVFATATPVMNSLAEVYTMQRYLQPQRLRELGFENFDNWYATFAQAKAVTEQRPDGSYQEVMRVAKFRNAKLLYRIASEVMDYVGWDDMPYLKLPKLKDNKITVIQGEPHPLYDTIQQWFTRRLAAIRDLPPHWDKNRQEYIAPDRYHPITGANMQKKDNILTVMNDAKLAAIDARLVLGEHANDTANSRVQTVAKDVADYYKRENKNKGVALIFLDVGTPKTAEPLEFLKGVTVDDETEGDALGVEDAAEDPDDENASALASAEFDGEFNLYEATKRALIARGIPSHEIAFIHQARNAAERLALFEAANEGKIRVLLASTDKGGLGMNIQSRGGLLVEFDAPRAMRPGDIRQRHGRFIRQGNAYNTIEIRRYVTKGTTDEWLYGLLGQKQGMITEFMKGELDEYEDVDPTTMSLSEAEAFATNDKRKIELLKLKGSLTRLEAQAAAASQQLASAKSELAQTTHAVAGQQAAFDRVTAWIASSYKKLVGEDFTVKVGEQILTKRNEANDALMAALKPFVEQAVALTPAYRGAKVSDTTAQPIGEIGGLPITARVGMDHDGVQYVTVAIDADVLGEGDIGMTLIAAGLDGKAKPHFGEGRNVMATLVDRYNAIPALANHLADQLKNAKDRIARAEHQIAHPSDAPAKLATAKARIDAIEHELRIESQAKDAEAARAHKEEKLARQQATPSGNASVGEYDTGPSAPSNDPTTETFTGHALEFPELVAFAKALLNVPQVVRRFRTEGALGMFSAVEGAPRGTIRLHRDLFKAGNEAQLTATLAHEIGHLIDWLPDWTLKRGNILGHLQSVTAFLKNTYTAQDGTTISNKKVREELLALSKSWRPWDEAKESDAFNKYRKSAKELYADAISVLLNRPDRIKAEAETFYKEFLAELDKKPEVKQHYYALYELVSGTREDLVQRRLEGIEGMFSVADTTAQVLDQQRSDEREFEWKDFSEGFQRQVVDKHMPVIERVIAAEKQTGRPLNPDENPRYLLSARNYLGATLKTWMQRHIEPLYKSLTGTQVPWTTFGMALFFERVIAGDRSELANPRGMQPDAAREAYAQMKRQLSGEQRRILAEQLTNFRAAVKAIAEEAYHAGLYTDKQYAAIQANEFYATFQVIEHMDETITSRIYQQIGTLKDINNPANSTILKTLATIRATEHQKVKVATFKFLEEHGRPGDIKDADEVPTFKGGRRPVPPSKASDQHLRLVTYFDKGKLKGKYVDPFIADSLENVSIGNNWFIVKGLQFVNKYLRRIFTSWNLGYQGYNVARDFLRFWRNMPHMSLLKATKLYWQAIPVARVRSYGLSEKPTPAQVQAWEDMLSAQDARILGISFNEHMKTEDVEEQQILNILKRTGVGGFDQAVQRHFLVRPLFFYADQMEKLGDFIEALPKVAAMYEYKGEESIDQIPQDVRHFIRTKVGSPDFLAGGTLKPLTNNLFLFSNAILQGVRSDYQVAVNPTTRWGFAWKTMVVNWGPKLLTMAALLAASGAGGAGDKDDSVRGELKGFLARMARMFPGAAAYGRLLRKVSEYDLTNYISVPIGSDARGNTIYLRLPQDDTGRFIGGLFWKGLKVAIGDKQAVSALADLLDYTGGQLPSKTPILESGAAILEYAAGQNIYDPFRNRMLFTEDEVKARSENWRAFNKFLGWEFQQLGGSVVAKFYPGGEKPSRKTTGQKILDFGPMSNIAGRYLKISSYGEVERDRAISDKFQAKKINRRQNEQDAINDAVREYYDGSTQSVTRQRQMARDVARELYPDERGAKHDATVKRLTARMTLSVLKGEVDTLGETVLSAQGNDEKAELIVAAEPSMKPGTFDTWVREAQREGVITKDVADKVKKLRQAR